MKECDFPKAVGSCIWRKQVKAMGKCFQKSGKELIKYYYISIAQINDIHCRYVVFVRKLLYLGTVNSIKQVFILAMIILYMYK